MMAPMNGARPQTNYELPPSSILASKVVNGNSNAEFDQVSFNQLLEELLGIDEHGQPNIGSDVSINHKVIGIVIKAGIDPVVDDFRNNPFRSKTSGQKDEEQFISCLEVIRLCIERSPQVLLVKSVPDEHYSVEDPIPFYLWLFPKMVSLINHDPKRELQQAVVAVVAAMISPENMSSNMSGSDPVLDFVQECVLVLVDHVLKDCKLTMLSPVNINDDQFMTHMWKHSAALEGVASRLRFKNIEHMLYSLSIIMPALSRSIQSPQQKFKFKKLLYHLQECLEQLENAADDTSQIESMIHDLSGLNLARRYQLPSHCQVPDTGEWSEGGRVRKRARLSKGHEDTPAKDNHNHQIIRQLTGALSGHPVSDLEGLNKTAPTSFRRLPEEQQFRVIELIGETVCRLSNKPVNLDVCVCCNEDVITYECSYSDAAGELLKTLLSIVTSPARLARSRVVAMHSLKRILVHTDSLDDLRLNQPAGEWCLQSLKSSSRDLRFAAVQVLQVYVRNRKSDTSLTHDNRVIALDFLQSLWQKNEIAIQETVVQALTRMALVVGDEELNIILLRLVDALGNSNPYISGLVYSEIQQLAQSLQVTIAVLMRPFWRTLGVVAAKSMTSRPAVAQQLCGLLGMQLSGLMLLIEEYALPYLVLNKNHNLIQQFAAAHGPSHSAFDICTQRKNLTAILSFLLAQGFPDPQQTIMELLTAVSSDFAAENLAGWLAHDPIQISCELLKAVVDAGEGKASRTYQALQSLAQIQVRKPGSQASKRSENIGSFLEANALAIVTHFTVLLNDTEARESKLEKRRCLVALGELVKLGKGRVVVALPQICACLRSALDDLELCNAAFMSWSAVLTSLKEEDIEPLVDQSLAIIIKNWESFTATTHQQAYIVIADLLQKHTALVREIYETMPSLSSIPLMSKFDAEIGALKRQMDERHQLLAFVNRLMDENITVVEQALTELSPILRSKQDLLHRAILREQPDTLIAELTRALLDCCVKFQSNNNITRLCGQCLGSIGCIDPNKIDTTVERKSIVVLSNFGKAEETVDFIMFFLEHVLVNAFLSASTTRGQGFLAWAMQEFLKLCDTEEVATTRVRLGSNPVHRKWQDLPEGIRNTLTPFVTSKYAVQEARPAEKRQYPSFNAGTRHQDWLRGITLDFLHRGHGDNVELIFGICCRIIHGQNTAIPAFLLPYAALNLVISGTKADSDDMMAEIKQILKQSLHGKDRAEQEDIRLCSQSIFEILDYMSRWVHQKRKQYAIVLARSDRGVGDPLLENALTQIQTLERMLESIPPDLLSQRAIECKSYARALFHWEQFMRKAKSEDQDTQLARLQDIYAQIDEPDGIEGISSRMQFVNIEQRVVEHKTAGRWTAAQSWYQMEIGKHPDDIDLQRNLMDCLRESGQYDVLLDRFEAMVPQADNTLKLFKPYAVEASWATGRWDKLAKLLNGNIGDDFSTHLGTVLLSLHKKSYVKASDELDELYRSTSAYLTPNAISSLQSCHDTILKLHILDDVRIIASSTAEDKESSLQSLGKRLDILGSNVADKQYLLGIRRAAMMIKSDIFADTDVANAWLASARLARKAQASLQALDAVTKASALGEHAATIEEAKLMWQEGHHRKAIQSLEGAINSGALVAHNNLSADGPVTMTSKDQEIQNEKTSKAYLLLGKWLDQAGQTQSDVIIKTFRKSTENFRKGEKGWYSLGHHYNKLVDSQRLLPPGKESQTFLTGEMSKLVIENYFRCLITGSKYVFQTLPKILTLWLEMLASVEQPTDPKRGSENFQAHTAAQRKKVIEETNAYIKKYIERLQPVVLYTILSQVVARIGHSNTNVYNILTSIIVKVVRSMPQQALWTLLPLGKSQSKERCSRGLSILVKVVEAQKRSNSKDTTPAELRSLIQSGQRVSDELIRIADFPIEQKIPKLQLARDMGFNHKIAPSKLVVPCESALIPSMPTSYDTAYLKTFRPFSKEPVTITAFLDEALVMASIAKPRKLSIRGSDGNIYGILAKPKDDLRKDQRLMEFDNMINRFLKRDVGASKRRLHIRTYAVIPLNEECGLIEWVNNLRTLRDIVVRLYKDRNITLDFVKVRNMLDEACSGPPEKISIFTNRVLPLFPPVLHDWFVESFPDPSTWFNARLRYTRSCAVMSIVGHVLGLGDRHSENILFEEDNGQLMHVDFNCLFDKGMTFEKPERVPFRLTHNMVDAMGAYGYEGPFRRCCEITLTLLRANQDALMTILETFLHDPTTDFMDRGGRSKKKTLGVPDTPEEVLESVRMKTRGMLAGESVPLSVGGYVEEVIKQSVDEKNLARMYIGWCAFF